MTEPVNPLESEPAPESGMAPKSGKLSRWIFYSCAVAIMGFLVAITILNTVKPRTGVAKGACPSHLKLIGGAVQQWALENHKKSTDRVTTTDVLAFLKGSTLPSCPQGGTYSVSIVGEPPRCTKSSERPGEHSIEPSSLR